MLVYEEEEAGHDDDYDDNNGEKETMKLRTSAIESFTLNYADENG